MMTKLVLRGVSCLLIPCLLLDPRWVQATVFPSRSSVQISSQALVTACAMSPREMSDAGFRSRFSDLKKRSSALWRQASKLHEKHPLAQNAASWTETHFSLVIVGSAILSEALLWVALLTGHKDLFHHLGGWTGGTVLAAVFGQKLLCRLSSTDPAFLELSQTLRNLISQSLKQFQAYTSSAEDALDAASETDLVDANELRRLRQTILSTVPRGAIAPHVFFVRPPGGTTLFETNGRYSTVFYSTADHAIYLSVPLLEKLLERPGDFNHDVLELASHALAHLQNAKKSVLEGFEKSTLEKDLAIDVADEDDEDVIKPSEGERARLLELTQGVTVVPRALPRWLRSDYGVITRPEKGEGSSAEQKAWLESQMFQITTAHAKQAGLPLPSPRATPSQWGWALELTYYPFEKNLCAFNHSVRWGFNWVHTASQSRIQMGPDEVVSFGYFTENEVKDDKAKYKEIFRQANRDEPYLLNTMAILSQPSVLEAALGLDDFSTEHPRQRAIVQGLAKMTLGEDYPGSVRVMTQHIVYHDGLQGRRTRIRPEDLELIIDELRRLADSGVSLGRYKRVPTWLQIISARIAAAQRQMLKGNPSGWNALARLYSQNLPQLAAFITRAISYGRSFAIAADEHRLAGMPVGQIRHLAVAGAGPAIPARVLETVQPALKSLGLPSEGLSLTQVDAAPKMIEMGNAAVNARIEHPWTIQNITSDVTQGLPLETGRTDWFETGLLGSLTDTPTSVTLSIKDQPVNTAIDPKTYFLTEINRTVSLEGYVQLSTRRHLPRATRRALEKFGFTILTEANPPLMINRETLQRLAAYNDGRVDRVRQRLNGSSYVVMVKQRSLTSEDILALAKDPEITTALDGFSDTHDHKPLINETPQAQPVVEELNGLDWATLRGSDMARTGIYRTEMATHEDIRYRQFDDQLTILLWASRRGYLTSSGRHNEVQRLMTMVDLWDDLEENSLPRSEIEWVLSKVKSAAHLPSARVSSPSSSGERSGEPSSSSRDPLGASGSARTGPTIEDEFYLAFNSDSDLIHDLRPQGQHDPLGNAVGVETPQTSANADNPPGVETVEEEGLPILSESTEATENIPKETPQSPPFPVVEETVNTPETPEASSTIVLDPRHESINKIIADLRKLNNAKRFSENINRLFVEKSIAVDGERKKLNALILAARVQLTAEQMITVIQKYFPPSNPSSIGSFLSIESFTKQMAAEVQNVFAQGKLTPKAWKRIRSSFERRSVPPNEFLEKVAAESLELNEKDTAFSRYQTLYRWMQAMNELSLDTMDYALIVTRQEGKFVVKPVLVRPKESDDSITIALPAVPESSNFKSLPAETMTSFVRHSITTLGNNHSIPFLYTGILIDPERIKKSVRDIRLVLKPASAGLPYTKNSRDWLVDLFSDKDFSFIQSQYEYFIRTRASIDFAVALQSQRLVDAARATQRTDYEKSNSDFFAEDHLVFSRNYLKPKSPLKKLFDRVREKGMTETNLKASLTSKEISSFISRNFDSLTFMINGKGALLMPELSDKNLGSYEVPQMSLYWMLGTALGTKDVPSAEELAERISNPEQPWIEIVNHNLRMIYDAVGDEGLASIAATALSQNFRAKIVIGDKKVEFVETESAANHGEDATVVEPETPTEPKAAAEGFVKNVTSVPAAEQTKKTPALTDPAGMQKDLTSAVQDVLVEKRLSLRTFKKISTILEDHVGRPLPLSVTAKAKEAVGFSPGPEAMQEFYGLLRLLNQDYLIDGGCAMTLFTQYDGGKMLANQVRLYLWTPTDRSAVTRFTINDLIPSFHLKATRIIPDDDHEVLANGTLFGSALLPERLESLTRKSSQLFETYRRHFKSHSVVRHTQGEVFDDARLALQWHDDNFARQPVSRVYQDTEEAIQSMLVFSEAANALGREAWTMAPTLRFGKNDMQESLTAIQNRQSLGFIKRFYRGNLDSFLLAANHQGNPILLLEEAQSAVDTYGYLNALVTAKRPGVLIGFVIQQVLNGRHMGDANLGIVNRAQSRLIYDLASALNLSVSWTAVTLTTTAQAQLAHTVSQMLLPKKGALDQEWLREVATVALRRFYSEGLRFESANAIQTRPLEPMTADEELAWRQKVSNHAPDVDVSTLRSGQLSGPTQVQLAALVRLAATENAGMSWPPLRSILEKTFSDFPDALREGPPERDSSATPPTRQDMQRFYRWLQQLNEFLMSHEYVVLYADSNAGSKAATMSFDLSKSRHIIVENPSGLLSYNVLNLAHQLVSFTDFSSLHAGSGETNLLRPDLAERSEKAVMEAQKGLAWAQQRTVNNIDVSLETVKNRWSALWLGEKPQRSTAEKLSIDNVRRRRIIDQALCLKLRELYDKNKNRQAAWDAYTPPNEEVSDMPMELLIRSHSPLQKGIEDFSWASISSRPYPKHFIAISTRQVLGELGAALSATKSSDALADWFRDGIAMSIQNKRFFHHILFFFLLARQLEDQEKKRTWLSFSRSIQLADFLPDDRKRLQDEEIELSEKLFAMSDDQQKALLRATLNSNFTEWPDYQETENRLIFNTNGSKPEKNLFHLTGFVLGLFLAGWALLHSHVSGMHQAGVALAFPPIVISVGRGLVTTFLEHVRRPSYGHSKVADPFKTSTQSAA